MAHLPRDRFVAPARWILAALPGGPYVAAALLEAVRSSDRRLGPATFLAALVRLERAGIVERLDSTAPPMYRLASQSKEKREWTEG